MESFVTARCFQLLKIKNGLFRREALYNTDLRTFLHGCTKFLAVTYVFQIYGHVQQKVEISLFVMEIMEGQKLSEDREWVDVPSSSSKAVTVSNM